MNDVTQLPVKRTSRLARFYRLTPQERRARLVQARWLEPRQAERLAEPGLDEAAADVLVENVVGVHALPLAVALNFVVNGEERLVPMAVEEPSIVAACSFAARLAREGGGFTTFADAPVTVAQVQLCDVKDPPAAKARIEAAASELLRSANAIIPNMVKRGGGARALTVRQLTPSMLAVHVHVDCRDAMGANTVNSVAEGLAGELAALAQARVGLRILTNLADERKVTARVRVPVAALASDDYPDGGEVSDRIIDAQVFAEVDPYRAATHNKGVMNGVDAVLVACGNDWRAVEAGAHAYAARHGRYGPLTRWWKGPDGALNGELTLPLPTSTVGGAAHGHPGVRRALELAGTTSATDLAMLAAAAGLASNLAALKALATEGIQRGHMSLHARRVAAEVGAQGELIDLVAAAMSREKVYRPERAAELLADLRGRRAAT